MLWGKEERDGEKDRRDRGEANVGRGSDAGICGEEAA
jgi:hypothetical protein